MSCPRSVSSGSHVSSPQSSRPTSSYGASYGKSQRYTPHSTLPTGGGLLGRFDHLCERASGRGAVPCEAAKPEYARRDFLKSGGVPEKLNDGANYNPSCNLNETKFHRGFQRRNRADIQPDAARLEKELSNEAGREQRALASVEATRQMKETFTFNILTGEGVGRECEYKPTGKRSVNPSGSMDATFAEHARDESIRMRNSRHRFFEAPAGQPSRQRAMVLFNEGLEQDERQASVLGYGKDGPQRTRTQSCGAADNFAHLRGRRSDPDWEPPRHVNQSQIVLG